jgi:hypothetical protein
LNENHQIGSGAAFVLLIMLAPPELMARSISSLDPFRFPLGFFSHFVGSLNFISRSKSFQTPLPLPFHLLSYPPSPVPLYVKKSGIKTN